ncbi:Retrovirus-related Pol polyprotein from transposon TNT 1-94 [Gossypium australe]|uniref:Retrovirus-related Pol polyprotein from transposon TNT 1-94 n=1 Tax=Gossypium australe TaxID=47621 RepID=A0A5B6WLP2_9ROSI|nr:Retrovirus-related Pol polyprotein from transposon TNT 1-94 [Gossypium australe]
MQTTVMDAAHSTLPSLPIEFWLWHRRLGHPLVEVLNKVMKKCKKSQFVRQQIPLCEAYCMGKSHRLPFVSSTTTYTEPFQLVELDLWGPTHEPSSSYRYYLSCIDAFSRNRWLYLLKSKDEAIVAFDLFKELVYNQFSTTIIVVQTNWGGYSPMHYGYKCLDKDFGKVYISKHVVFNKHVFPFATSKSSLVTNALTEFESPHLFVVSSPQLSSSTVQFGSLPSSPLPMINASPTIAMSHSYTREDSFDAIIRSSSFPYKAHLDSPLTHGDTLEDTNTTNNCPTTNVHPMITDIKNNIYKPKLYSTILENQ